MRARMKGLAAAENAVALSIMTACPALLIDCSCPWLKAILMRFATATQLLKSRKKICYYKFSEHSNLSNSNVLRISIDGAPQRVR